MRWLIRPTHVGDTASPIMRPGEFRLLGLGGLSVCCMPEEPGIASAARVFARLASQGACTSLSSCGADQAMPNP